MGPPLAESRSMVLTAGAETVIGSSWTGLSQLGSAACARPLTRAIAPAAKATFRMRPRMFARIEVKLVMLQSPLVQVRHICRHYVQSLREFVSRLISNRLERVSVVTATQQSPL